MGAGGKLAGRDAGNSLARAEVGNPVVGEKAGPPVGGPAGASAGDDEESVKLLAHQWG